jgi:DNA replication and repair protein RecF
LREISLVNFRSYAAATLRLAGAPVVLAGPNGTGKTNCLEAVSLLSPGRGLRGAKLAALQRKVPVSTDPERSGPLVQSPWAVAVKIVRPDGEWEMATGLTSTSDGTQRRALYLNGAPAQAADFAELVPVLWLTPAMDRLFLEGASERRRFLDRLVFGLDASHARHAARYECCATASATRPG